MDGGAREEMREDGGAREDMREKRVHESEKGEDGRDPEKQGRR